MENINPSLKKEKTILISLIVSFSIFFALISLVRHYNFHSNAYDLGIFNQALYQYSHFSSGPNTVYSVPHLLGDHLEITLILLSPFYYIFRDYTLLIFQIIAVILGGFGIYKLSYKNSKDFYLSAGAMVVFFISFGTISAVNFDFHNNTLGINLLPWMILALQNKKIKLYYLLFALFLFSKEPMSLIGFFFGLGLILFKNKKVGIITSLLSLIYFFLALHIIIPHFNFGIPYGHWIYTNLGSSASEAIKSIIANPITTFLKLFNYDEKIFTWFIFLIGGGILSILFAPFSIMLIPITAQKFLADSANYWGFRYHYSIELNLVSAIALPFILIKLKPYVRHGLIAFFIAINFYISCLIDYTDQFRLKDLFTFDYYYNPERENLIKIINKIPPNASVSTMDNIVPHMANRKNIYLYGLYPEKDTTDYILLNTKKSSYPISNSEFQKKFTTLLKNPDFTLIDSDGTTFLFRKTPYKNL